MIAPNTSDGITSEVLAGIDSDIPPGILPKVLPEIIEIIFKIRTEEISYATSRRLPEGTPLKLLEIPLEIF